jgi:nickel/cobalt exporter
MDEKILVLCGSSAFLGVLHTVLGPDHYHPFIAMSRARNWSYYKGE